MIVSQPIQHSTSTAGQLQARSAAVPWLTPLLLLLPLQCVACNDPTNGYGPDCEYCNADECILCGNNKVPSANEKSVSAGCIARPR